MTLKKIVAREVLIFLTVSVICGAFVLYIEYDRKRVSEKRDELKRVENVLQEKYDSLNSRDSILNRPYVVRVKWGIDMDDMKSVMIPDSLFYYKMALDEKFIDKVYQQFKLRMSGFDRERKEFGQRIQKSSSDGQKYFEFSNALDKAILEVKYEIDQVGERRKVLNDILQGIIIVIVAIAYPLRILFYIIRWSIKTLRTPNPN